MPVKPEDCISVRKIKNRTTTGGDTYMVILDGSDKERALCFRTIPKHTEFKCIQPAGKGTDHVGHGACKNHGGMVNEDWKRMKTGKMSHVTRRALNHRIKKYLRKDRATLLDLSSELAHAKAVFEEFVEDFPDPSAKTYGITLHRFQQLLGTIGSLVEKQSKIDARNTITAAQVMYLRVTIANLLLKWVPSEDRERALSELAAMIGGDDLETTIKPSEVRMIDA